MRGRGDEGRGCGDVGMRGGDEGTRGRGAALGEGRTFFLTRDMTPMRVSTCCLDSPSRGTPSANVSEPSAPGSQR